MVKYFSNLVFAALVLFPLSASAQLPNRDSVIVESLKLLRPIHFSHDIGSEVRAVRRTFVRLHREQYQREKNRRALLRNAPFLSLDSIWQHNYAEQETLMLVLIFLKKTQLPDGIPNPRLMRFYEYLRKE